MDSASFQFVAFGLVMALISNLSRAAVWRSAVLMAGSLIFLALCTKSLVMLIPLAGFLILGYFALHLLQRGYPRLKVWMVLAVIFAYVWLKKYTILPERIFLDHPYVTLGLSYILFRVLHLLIDAAEPGKVRIGFGSYLLYNINFTTFVSGPIQRYEEFARDQFTEPPIHLTVPVIGMQIERIILGFFKVNVLAAILHALQDDAIAQLYQPLPSSTKLFAAFRLALIYPLFLYSNFSGYIDIVIALARLMRVRLPENFNRPFAAASVIDFWNRWHMTLSNWLKTYVYNPLLIALMRRIPSLSMQPYLGVFCFFVTFFLIGIWHGRTFEFVVFGVLTGGGMSINKLWQIGLTRARGRKGYQRLANNVLYESLARGLNFVWFSFTLFWFWGDGPQLHRIFSSVSTPQWLGVWLVAWFAAATTLASWEWLRAALLRIEASGEPILANRYVRVVFATGLGLMAFVMTGLLDQPAPGIVYKAF
jgi:D-alanyl-lipoteichoic acid acyltransferase DltB (MBOAT superfamily)